MKGFFFSDIMCGGVKKKKDENIGMVVMVVEIVVTGIIMVWCLKIRGVELRKKKKEKG